MAIINGDHSVAGVNASLTWCYVPDFLGFSKQNNEVVNGKAKLEFSLISHLQGLGSGFPMLPLLSSSVTESKHQETSFLCFWGVGLITTAT